MIDNQILANHLIELQAKKALVIGDVMLDKYVIGQVNRISPEAPIPVLSHETTKFATGGAANVARNLSMLGSMVHLIGVVGQDETAKQLINTISHCPNLDFEPIFCSDRPTTLKTRFLSSGQQMLRVDSETRKLLSEKDGKQLITQAKAALKEAEILILSDYAKGCLSADLIQSLIQMAHQQKIPVLIDPKSTDFSWYRGADFITPNLAELQKATGLECTDIEQIAQVANDLLNTHKIGHILVTIGARGMILVNKDGFVHLPAFACEVFDVSGAGDTVIAMLASAVITGMDAKTAAQTANLAASLVVGKTGTSCLAIGELLAARKTPYLAPERNNLQKQVQDWQADGKKVGFTNGCFDLLHSGHLHLLRQAAQSCDKLIVAVNSDNSVRQLKGAARPVQNQDKRISVLAALPFVDVTLLFDEDTPLELITQLQPDILMKGGDYQIADIAGHDIVLANKGEVKSLPVLKGFSTTHFLNNLSIDL